MKRKLIITIILISNFLFTGTTYARNFSDVSLSHKNHKSISSLSDQNIINGYPNGSFHPERNINRAEAVKILIEALFDQNTIINSLNWHYEQGHNYIIYPDVEINKWYGPHVEIAYQNNIIKGYPDGTFKPSDNINFAEALKIILESYKVDVSTTPYENHKLLYVKQSDWFAKYFNYAYEHNLINQNKFYHPGQLITRGEFVEIIYRLQSVMESGLPEFIANKLPTSNEYTVTIPKLNVINVDVSFADISDATGALNLLKKGMGNYLSKPGDRKKIVLFGHSSGYSWDNSNYKRILRQINTLSNGDKIYLNYKEKGYAYELFKSEIIPQSEDYKIIANQNNNELTMYTCWPPDSIAQRYIVYAKPIS